MSASARTRTGAGPSLTERLDASAYTLLAILPLGMALINRSAQPLLLVAALLACAARVQAGETREVRERLLRLLTTPLGSLALAAMIYAALSMFWGHHLRVSASAYLEFAGALLAGLLLHLALPRSIPAWAIKLATVALALGCLTIVAELATGMTVRPALGGRPDTFIFKRSVAAMLVVFWPVAALLWLTGRAALAVALGLLLAIAIYAAHSSATGLALMTGLAALLVSLLSRRLMPRVLAAALAAAFLVAPVLGDAAVRLLPQRLVDRLHFAHADQRIELWQSFGEVVKRRPILGVGYGTSRAMPRDPVAAEVPQERRHMLGAWHPHNAYLQVWTEMGAIGALLVGATLIVAVLALARAGPTQATVAVAVVASAATIMTVGHGAWQGWWTTMLGAAAVWIARFGSVRPAARDAPPRRP